MKSVFSRVSTVLLVLALLIPGTVLIAPDNAQAFGSLSENGTAAFMGIGTVPQKILHVSGSGAGSVPLFQRGSDSAGFIIERTPTNRWVLGVNESPTLGNGFVLSTIPTGTTSVPRLLVTPAGRVGIGTVNPDIDSKLHVVNTDAINGSRAVYGEVTHTGDAQAVYGKHTDSGNYGFLGDNTWAVYGYNRDHSTRGGLGGINYAGYFDGSAYVTDNLSVGSGPANSTLQVAGSFATAYRLVTGVENCTVNASDSVIAVQTTTDNIRVLLPNAVGITGRMYTIKKVGSLGFEVRIYGYMGQEIDEHVNYYLYSAMDYVTLISNGSGWYVISHYVTPP